MPRVHTYSVFLGDLFDFNPSSNYINNRWNVKWYTIGFWRPVQLDIPNNITHYWSHLSFFQELPNLTFRNNTTHYWFCQKKCQLWRRIKKNWTIGIEKALGKALRNASNKRDFEFGRKFFFPEKVASWGRSVGCIRSRPCQKCAKCHRSQTELKITQHTIEI